MRDKKVIYMVKYTDDRNKKHITFVRDMFSVSFLMERFEKVSYEKSFLVPQDRLFLGID